MFVDGEILCFNNYMIRGFFLWLHEWLHSPKKVLIFCLFFIFITLVLDGSLYRWWSLQQDYKTLKNRIEQNHQDLELLKVKINKAKDPMYIKHQAKDRFDFIEEDEMVFYFTKTEEN